MHSRPLKDQLPTVVNFKEHSHRRFSPLTREWLLVSPHRDQRPWQGQMEKVEPVRVPMYDPECFMCPGNARMGGERNPNYTSTFVFANDFSALEADTPLDAFNERDLLVAQGVGYAALSASHHGTI